MAEALKNVYTNEYITNLAMKIKDVYKEFNKDEFTKAVFDESWEFLELKERMRHIAIKLDDFLPFPYTKQLDILKPVSKGFYSFEAMFFQDFVEVYGLEEFEGSMDALEVFTFESSSEFAIRHFIIKYEDKTMQQMKKWTQNSNEHLRRLASEGCRPRLPWAIALSKYKNNPNRVLEIIELLKNDKSEYVRKSVANNLNDISKDNPNIVINFVSNNLGESRELDWICKHGSRTLLKKGNKEILNLFGFKNSSHIKIEKFICNESLNIGDDLNFSFDLTSLNNLGNIRIEYIIDYKKANGSLSKKIFMISQGDFNSKFKVFKRKQSFKNLSTRKHYKGKHFLSILINGEEKIKRGFILDDLSD
jgi:3-methyladenine DNA glycosylase AlkC